MRREVTKTHSDHGNDQQHKGEETKELTQDSLARHFAIVNAATGLRARYKAMRQRITLFRISPGHLLVQLLFEA